METFWQILLWFGAIAWTLMFVQLLINLVLIRDISRADLPEPKEWPFVSIIAPARDEEWLVREGVTSFCTQDYPHFEVIVVDDRSTDATPRILAELQGQFSNLKVLKGHDPPPGWLGKPNALQVGWKEAKGEWILAVDSDVVYAPDVLRRGMAYTLREGAGMCVLHPSAESSGVFKPIVISAVYLFHFAMLPLFLVAHSRSKLFATGSGVFNLICREAMEVCDGFACIKDEVVDDAAMGYRVKSAGFPLVVGCGGKMINFRWYAGGREAIRGFSKNTYPTIRNVPWLFPLLYLFGTTISLVPYFAFIRSLMHGFVNVPASVSLILMHIVLALLAIRFRQSWIITFCNPLREVIWWWVFARSFIIYCRKGIVWRDRAYKTDQASREAARSAH